MFKFAEKPSPRSKMLIDRYAEISIGKETNKIQFKENLFALVNDISNYINEVDQKEQFVKVFCECVDQIIKDINELRAFLSEENTFSILVNFMKTLASIKLPFNSQLQNLPQLLEILETSQDEKVNQILSAFYKNENWIQFIECYNYFPSISKLTDESLVRRNTLIFDSLSLQVKNYNKKSIQSYVETLSIISNKIPKGLRYPYSNLLYNIFTVNDDYFNIFRKKSGFDILIKIFKSNSNINADDLQSGAEMSDFFNLFLYKEFYIFLYEMIIEDEPELNGQNEEFDENLNTQNLIEKYLFKYACLNTLLSVVDKIKPDSFQLTKEQIINIGNIQLLDTSNSSLNSKIEGNKSLTAIRDNYSISFARLMTQLRTKIWTNDSEDIDNFMLKKFWNNEDGMNYFINIRNPTFLEYHTEYFKKFDSWEIIHDRMEKSDSLIALFVLMFSLPKENEFQTDENVEFMQHIYDIYESKNNLFNKIIKRIIKLSFSHFLFILKNAPNDEIFNAITILSFENCYSQYDLPLYSIFLKFSLQFNNKLLEVDNFKKMLNIYNINTQDKEPSSIQLDYLALILLDKKVMESNSSEIVSLASNIISKYEFDTNSCIDRLSFRILQEADIDYDNSLKILSRFQPSAELVPFYLSTNPLSTYLNDLFLFNENYQFDYLSSLDIIPRTFVKKLIFESDLVQNKPSSSILVAVLKLWPYMYNTKDENDPFKYYNQIIKILLESKNTSQAALDISLLILCFLHFNKVIKENDYNKLFEYFVTKLRSDQNKNFWFSLLISSHKISTSFLPLPFKAEDYPLNVPKNELEFSLSMPSFESDEYCIRNQMTLPCLVPFSDNNYSIIEESSKNSNDFTYNEIRKQTIHPNKEVIDDENTLLDYKNWQTFTNTLLLISDQIDSKKQENEKQARQEIEIIHNYLLQSMIDILFNNNTYKFKVNSEFLKAAFFGNPYEELTEIQNTLQIFTKLFTKQTIFNKVVFEFLLDCAIDGWFCEKIGVILNLLFKYYGQFKQKATVKMLNAYKLGFYNITVNETKNYLCIMKEFEQLFFSIFKREDYFFYYTHINELNKIAEEAKKNDPSKIKKYESIISKCKYSINLLNRKYHEIFLKNKKRPQKKIESKNEEGNDNEVKENSNKKTDNDNSENNQEKSNKMENNSDNNTKESQTNNISIEEEEEVPDDDTINTPTKQENNLDNDAKELQTDTISINKEEVPEENTANTTIKQENNLDNDTKESQIDNISINEEEEVPDDTVNAQAKPENDEEVNKEGKEENVIEKLDKPEDNSDNNTKESQINNILIEEEEVLDDNVINAQAELKNNEEVNEGDKEENNEEVNEGDKEENNEEVNEGDKEENNEKINNTKESQANNISIKEDVVPDDDTVSTPTKQENNKEANVEMKEESEQNNESTQEKLNTKDSQIDNISIEEEEEVPDDDIDEFSDADEEDFNKYEKSKKEKYENSLNNLRKSNENEIRKFRINNKHSFDSKILTLMNFVNKEVKESELTGENYRKIWIDSNQFDDTLLLRKAEYEFTSILSSRIDIIKNYISSNKTLIFTIIQFLTGIGDSNSYKIRSKLNNIEGFCFINANKIVFVEGLETNGEFKNNIEYDSEDEEIKKIIQNSHRFEGHILFEIIKKDTSKIENISKNIAKFNYININITIEDLSGSGYKLSKLLS